MSHSGTVVIDSGGGNIRSVMNALHRLGAAPLLTTDPGKIHSAQRLILPGVGAAATCINRIRECGLFPLLLQSQVPVLGICVGMQMLFSKLAEGPCQGLSLLEGEVSLLPSSQLCPVPHTGWNQVHACRSSQQPNHAPDPLLQGLDKAWFYFTHSYAAPLGPHAIGTTSYGREFASVIRKDNWWGVQFHPEKSAQAGELLLKNFLEVKL